MHPLVEKLRRALGPGRKESPSAILRKVVASAQALGWAAVSLRSCDAVGRGARSFGRPSIDNRGVVVIGDDFAVGCAFGTVLLATGPRGRIEIGDGVTVNYGSAIAAAARVRIGNRVMVGPHCVIADTDAMLAFDDEEAGSAIEIGDHVWLAGHVIVRPGAKIGAGTVVAAGSVVEGELPANAIASGVPARVLRIRRSDDAPETRPSGVPAEAAHAAV